MLLWVKWLDVRFFLFALKNYGIITVLRGEKGVFWLNESVLLIGSVIFICIVMKKYIDKIPIPSLIIFIALGMLFGENGIFRIVFNDYAVVNLICSVSLIFIMFFGGFGTNIRRAKPVAAQAVVLSTLGVIGTAFLVALFAKTVLHLSWLESLLIGSVISSTDAASVFNILRYNKLALKYHTDSLLEIESGSNDPISYMLTALTLSLMSGEAVSIPLLLFTQLSVGIACGLAVGVLAILLLKKQAFHSQQSYTIFLISIMLIAYSLPAVLQGNGYLSVYLCGILLGNTKLSQKRYLVHFFDVLTDVSQVIIFFLLGLLVTPVELPAVLLPAICIMVFLTVLARPLVCTALLLPFRAPLAQIGVVSFAGLRGAASIVFAISAVLSGVQTRYDLYNLVFCIVLLSISLQGTLLPKLSKMLHAIDEDGDVRKTFNDYQEESDISFIKIHLDHTHPWCQKTLQEIALPKDLLVAMIVRDGGTVIPGGTTRLQEGDLLVLAAKEFEEREHLFLREYVVDHDHHLADVPLSKAPSEHQKLIILIKRGNETMIPKGNTIVKPGDVLVVAEHVNQ